MSLRKGRKSSPGVCRGRRADRAPRGGPCPAPDRSRFSAPQVGCHFQGLHLPRVTLTPAPRSARVRRCCFCLLYPSVFSLCAQLTAHLDRGTFLALNKWRRCTCKDSSRLGTWQCKWPLRPAAKGHRVSCTFERVVTSSEG